MEQQEWKVAFRWIKAHAGLRGNELADQLEKEAASNKKEDECYNRLPKSEVMSELKEQSSNQWQQEWSRDHKRHYNQISGNRNGQETTKGTITKSVATGMVKRPQKAL